MRIRVIQAPVAAFIDGIDLRRFQANGLYEVGPAVGTLMVTEGWAVPLDPTEPDALDPSPPSPPNLLREIFPPYYDAPPALALDRRKHPRKR